MLLLANGVFGDLEKLAPLVAAEVEKVHQLRDEGLVVAAYRRADRTGVILVLDVASEEQARETLGQLPFAQAGLLDFDYEEVVPL